MNIFLLGLAFIPFDNLCFAPSRGWATIAPIIFFVYDFVNLKLLIKAITRNNSRCILYIAGAVCFQLLLLLFYGVHLRAFIDNVQTLVLGISFYFALVIRYQIIHANINHDAEFLYRAYIISFVYGIVRFFALNFSPALLSFFILIEKRPYARIAFTFTEPSFISAHVIGVLLLFTYLVSDSKLALKMIYLAFAFMIVSILTASSARCAADSVILMLLIFVKNFRLNQSLKKLLIKVSMLLFASIFIAVIFLYSSRLNNIISGGTNADSSMASRWFRVNACLHGFVNKNIQTLPGWGIGNMIIPFKSGFYDARRSFNNPYTGEVDVLENVDEIDSLFSLPVKIISEWGLILTLYIFVYIILFALKKKIDIYVLTMTCWLYVQFDSYAFYAAWILLYLINYYDSEKHGISYFNGIQNIFTA